MSNKVTICHWTGSGDYKIVTANKNGILNGHNPSQGIHHGDIIPPFDGFPGHNWDEEGIAIWEAHCTVPVVEEPEVPVDPRPEAEFRWTEGEPVEDCETGEVTMTLTEESAGYYLGESSGEWVLGDWVPTGNTETLVITAAEGCPVAPEEPEDSEEPVTPVDETPIEEEPVVEIPEDVATDPWPSWTYAPEVVDLAETQEIVSQPTPPALVNTGITGFGIESYMVLALGLALAATGVTLLAKKLMGSSDD